MLVLGSEEVGDGASTLTGTANKRRVSIGEEADVV